MDKFEQFLLKLYELNGSHRIVDICNELEINTKDGWIYTVLPRLIEMKIFISISSDREHAKFLINHNEIDNYFKNVCFGFFKRIRDGKVGIE